MQATARRGVLGALFYARTVICDTYNSAVDELKKSSKEMAQMLEAQRAEIVEMKAMLQRLMETIQVDSKV